MNLKKFLIICSILFALSTIEATAFIFKNKTIIHSDDYIKNYLYGSILYDEKDENTNNFIRCWFDYSMLKWR